MIKETIQTNLICPECGSVFPIMRKKYKQKKNYHLKSLYCPTCKVVTNHIEIPNLDMYLAEIEFKEEYNRTPEEKEIYQLVKKR